MAEPRQNINIELAEGNKERLELLRHWNGMTQKELVGRIINWFCDQDRVAQQIILGQIPQEIAQDVAQMMLERIANGQTPPNPYEQRMLDEQAREQIVAEVSTQRLAKV